MVTVSSTGNSVTKTVIGIIILALLITVFIQHRRIIMLNKKANELYSQEELEKYKIEIKRLESQIADLKAKKDHPVTIVDKVPKAWTQEMPAENRVVDISSLNNRADVMNNPNMRNNLRRSITGRYEAFTAENNLSEETKSKLYDLLAEMRMEIMNRFPRPERGDIPPEMIDREAFMQQMEEINSKYNKKISEVLSDNELNAFREFQNSEPERMLLRGFNVVTEENMLDTEKQNALISAMYNARQNDPETRRDDDALMIEGGPPFGRAPMNEGAENDEKLNSVYLESAKNILSEDQMKKFEDFLNSRQSMLDRRRMPPPDGSQGME